uniref:Peroxiredoxin-like 2A n=1 Tax=Hippocampus comes TaxID=109280 RepID=A0A3Q3D4S0_HIPCM
MRDIRPELCGRRAERWSWWSAGLDDCCAERRPQSCPLSSLNCRTWRCLSLLLSKRTWGRSWTASRSTSPGKSMWIRRSPNYVAQEFTVAQCKPLSRFSVSSQRNFYGPQERWMFLSVFLRIGVWRNLWRAYRRGFRGNLRGEGLVLGGVFVIGPGDQGILLEHREKEFGDKVNMLAVLRTARKMRDEMKR